MSKTTLKPAARPLTAHLGAEIDGVQIASDLPDETITWIGEKLVEHKVLVFRDQTSLGPEEHVGFGRRFGKLESHPFEPHLDGNPEVMLITAEDHYPGADDTWHSDVTMRPEPPLGAILRAVDIPPVGRDTLWADMEALFAGLSPTLQRFLLELTAVHHFPQDGHFLRRSRERGTLEADLDSFESVEHPVVRVHPVSGRKSLFVNSYFTQSIVGLSRAESKALLAFLFEQLHNPDFQVRVRWAPGTVVFWDNRSTQHALAFDKPGRRVMQRVTIAGDRPFGVAPPG